MTSEKITCSACGLFCGFIVREGNKVVPPAFPDHCPNKKASTWEGSSTKCITLCPVAQMIEEMAPGSLEELKLPVRGAPSAKRDPQGGIEKDPDAFKRADLD